MPKHTTLPPPQSLLIARPKPERRRCLYRSACPHPVFLDHLLELLSLLLFDRVKVRADHFVHLEHVHSRLFENGMHFVVATDLPLVFGVLKIVAFNMLPELLNDLWAGELGGVSI